MKKLMIFICTMLTMLFIAGCGTAEVDYVAKELGVANEVNDLLKSGKCWIACSNDKALILYINGDESTIITVADEGNGDVSVKDMGGKWNLDETNFTIFSEDGDAAGDFEWNIIQEEEITAISLKGEGIDADFYLTQVDNSDAAVELAKSYIVHQTTEEEVEEIEDISDVLTEYKGISIVDAFIRAGMEPSLKNRKTFAEKAGIENYTGTAKQNLFLIEYMGGKLK